MEAGGHLETYGFRSLSPGDPIVSCLYFLQGMVPSNGEGMVLNCVEVEKGIPMDIHIVPEGDRDWVLLLNAEKERERLFLLRQTGNELSLLRERIGKCKEK